ncbi:hypothetical protein BDV96DRAFT_353030 [Lophiotrema nucula]|uniref:Mid2 domain-containing protein n=1 Tax=Lophiotrema nucula TaxID=690887 RepID=A0A6A5ZKT8_9PLEO|nr:hypothetical protein BDV96DRAFT_353030 [Lophiotrema nucula]
MGPIPSLLSVFLITIFITFTFATAYLPNGTLSDDQGSAPCSTDPTNPLRNTYCHTNWDNPPGGDLIHGSTADECMPNGLCQNRGVSTKSGEEQPPWTRYYRVYCGTATWEGCLEVCSTGPYADHVVQVTPCDGTSTSEKWCCENSTACCNTDTAIVIPQVLGRANLSASVSSSASAPLSPATATSSPTAAAHSSGGISGGQITGVVVGSIIGGLLMGLVGFLVWFRWQRGRAMTAKENNEQGVFEHRIAPQDSRELEAESRHELGDENLKEARNELA